MKINHKIDIQMITEILLKVNRHKTNQIINK
jgi:hypothetical protein